ncbi:hypothetical protein [Solimonas flava]|uniref:hypothetical protein n=1 Tax=Solimonas flava TaxID=415849 RepID=UPI000425B7DD|nr:hypothetical protein [Solimonas flava]
MNLRRVAWWLITAYSLIAWSSVVLTAVGVTDWTWAVALSPMWVPIIGLLLAMILADLYRDSRRFARACRRAWSRITRPLRRAA